MRKAILGLVILVAVGLFGFGLTVAHASSVSIQSFAVAGNNAVVTFNNEGGYTSLKYHLRANDGDVFQWGQIPVVGGTQTVTITYQAPPTTIVNAEIVLLEDRQDDVVLAKAIWPSTTPATSTPLPTSTLVPSTPTPVVTDVPTSVPTSTATVIPTLAPTATAETDWFEITVLTNTVVVTGTNGLQVHFYTYNSEWQSTFLPCEVGVEACVAKVDGTMVQLEVWIDPDDSLGLKQKFTFEVFEGVIPKHLYLPMIAS